MYSPPYSVGGSIRREQALLALDPRFSSRKACPTVALKLTAWESLGAPATAW